MVVVSSVLLLPPFVSSFPSQRGLCLVVRATKTRSNNSPRKGSPSSSSSSTGRKKLSKNNSATNPNKLKARTSNSLRSISGGETATTYTRLPPRDDFLVLTPGSSEKEVTFFDMAKNKQFSLDDEYTSGIANAEVGDGKEEEEEEEIFYENVGFNYGEFESFSGDGLVSSEGGEQNDEDDDYDEEEEMEGFESDDGTTMVESSSSSGSGFVDGEEGFEEGEEKGKGVPAVMRCFDRAKVYVKAGNGGNGVVAFRREKYVPHGGPSGGDGGRGGNIYVEVDGNMNSLLPFRKNIHFRAGRGSHGQGRKQAGAKGENVVMMVAPGTVIREAGKEGEEGNVLLELLHPGQRALLLPGGRGGRGNASFKSGTNKVPKIAEIGEEGAEMWLDLELKLVADVGIVGAPNAGKSTLLSVTSAAQPTIANYPFTTLLPNLGVVSFDYDSTMVVADLPGLLEGAHRGFGLGHEFLRHTERCSVLVHVVDGSGQQPEYEFDAVRLELELFNPELSVKPFVVAFNKMDLPEAYEKWISFKEHLEAQGIKPFCMSAVNRQGTHEVISAAYQLLRDKQEAEKKTEGWTEPLNVNHVAERVHKQRNASINDFEISHDSDSSSWFVVGAGIQRFVQMTNWKYGNPNVSSITDFVRGRKQFYIRDNKYRKKEIIMSYSESMRRFQHVLEACGVNKSLIKLGVKEGDRVVVGEMEMIWHDKNDNFGSKSSTGSVKWPQFLK